jgi:hypothetical protein
MCKSLSRRMKGTGMRCSASNAESMVALEALQQSNLWPRYWLTWLATRWVGAIGKQRLQFLHRNLASVHADDVELVLR